MSAHTPGPWMAAAGPSSIVGWPVVAQGSGFVICNVAYHEKLSDKAVSKANAELIASAPTLAADNARLRTVNEALVKALRLHQAWADSEHAGPDYGKQTRDTHPDGEHIWRRWWDSQLDLCDRANEATTAALSLAKGEG